MSVFKSVLAAFRTNSDASELGRGNTSLNISSPISVTSDNDPNFPYPYSSRSTSSESVRREGPGRETPIDFNKKLPRRPTHNDNSFAEKPEKTWRKVFRLWIPLEMWAKFVVVLSFCEAMMAIWAGMQIILAGKLKEGKFWTIMISVLLAWGNFFGAAAYCAFAILWGRWRNSVTAVHFLRLAASLFTIIYSVASSLWFFYAFQSSTKTRALCLDKKIIWDGNEVQAPDAWVQLCLDQGEAFGRLQVAWGFMNGFQVYFMMLLVMWAAIQERTLRRQSRWSRSSGSDFNDHKSFESMADIETPSFMGDNFEKTLAERVEEYARKEKLERQVPKAVEIGMKIPNFPMPNKIRPKNNLLSPAMVGPAGRKPSTIPETIEEILRSRDESLPRLSGASALSGAIPIALDLRNAPMLYGRAF